MRTNAELQNDVMEAIKWEPSLNAAEIGVTAKDGVVSLTGVVDSYGKKMEAENAAKSVNGVMAIVEKIDVRFPDEWNKTNAEIALDVLNSLKANWSVPNNIVTVKVEKEWVTLEGELSWNYQRDAAKNAVMNLRGVKGVTCNITIKAESGNTIEKKDLESALERSWAMKGSVIEVKVDGTKVILTGTVHSWYQKDEAGRIAWKTPGIYNVDNNLLVDSVYNFK